ncbi:MAG: glucose 1-dehydrogenase [Reyranella sp.]|uniref:glucose 1-dehydrogenase n=1 Tax=Reyranella sp. TaxID=1929291 RepID=UPI00272FB647|nr:glucose 1-dehydrogenase [Reyranella sp.]MDP1965342.1 glucose 1-dehydrogenase [Reyranella sp.]MDP2375833.1 glucose 1-dehydrogenase [Reyranella sp.]
MPRLEDKVVLLSGGASGIGAATARLVVREGGKAVLADRDEAKGCALAAELGAAAHFVPLDVTQEPSWQAAVAAAVEKFGALHGLLNAAGIGVRNTIEDCTLEEYRRINDINSLGTFLGCKSAITAMRGSGGGSIVNISSVLGLRGAAHAMAYSASKGAVRTLTKNVALHCAQMKYNIRCNSVHPGYIDTPMIAPRLEQNVENMTGRQFLEDLHPLGRLGRPEEVANMILFLLSDESTFSTGSEFVCDGGLTA